MEAVVTATSAHGAIHVQTIKVPAGSSRQQDDGGRQHKQRTNHGEEGAVVALACLQTQGMPENEL